MTGFFSRLNLTGKCYLIIDIIIILSFLFLPFLSVFGIISGSACYIPYRILSLYLKMRNLSDSSSSDYSDDDSELADIAYSLEGFENRVLLGFGVSLLLYVILILAVIALFFFFRKKDKNFINFSFAASVVTLLQTVVIWGVRYYAIHQLEDVIYDFTDEYLYDYVSGTIDEFVSFEVGFYLLLIVGAIGFIIYFLPNSGYQFVQGANNSSNPGQAGGVRNNFDLPTMPEPVIPANTPASTTSRTRSLKKGKLRLINESFPGSAIRIEVLPLLFGSGEQGSIRLLWVRPGVRFGLYEYQNEIIITNEGEIPGIKLNGAELSTNKCYRLENGDIVNVDGRDIVIEI